MGNNPLETVGAGSDGQPPKPQGGAKAPVDTLLQCLVFLTAHYGRAKSAEAIRAGLAYDEKGMGPELFLEAATRLGLKARIVKRAPLTKIPPPVLPAVLTMRDGQACVLVSYPAGGRTARIFWPGTGETSEEPLQEIEDSYTGYAIYVHPNAVFTDPEAPHDYAIGKHWFWGAVLDNVGLYWRVCVAAVLTNIFGLTSSIYIMNVYNRVIPNNAMETGWVLAIGAMTVLVFDFIMRTLRGYFIDLAGRRIDVVVTRRIYDHLLDMKLAGKPASGGAFASMVREFESVRDFLTSATMTAVVDLPFTLFFLLVIWMLGGPIAFMLSCLILTVIGAGMLLQWPLKRLVARSLNSGEAKHGLLVETIGGLETIKAISADGRMRARYGSHVGEAALQGQRSRFISALGINVASFLQQSASIIVVLMGMYMVRDQEISIGALIACVMIGGRAIAPIGQIANLMTRYHQARSSLRTLNNIMALPSERPPHKRFLHRPELHGKIAFEKVSFVYPQTNRKVLDGVSFTVNAGEKVGLIGRVGSGKSTVARLALGLYEPSEGMIYADDTDYRQIDPADLRRNTAYIAQDVVLFRGSVRENITVSRPQASEEEILSASRAAGVHEFISRHPMGYDAPVGERGEGLSGGQRQAIALARAMLLKPGVMVCDEPTNAMDTEAEQSFIRHIREQVADKTLLLITHRQHLLTLVDRLILIDQGKVVMDGSREEVMAFLSGGKTGITRKPGPGGGA